MPNPILSSEKSRILFNRHSAFTVGFPANIANPLLIDGADAISVTA
jgi:hypothetical protein